MPTFLPQLEQYNRVRRKQCKKGPRQSPTKWVWWGKEESPKGISSGHSGTTELLPRKAKRRMWSLRRRGASFSPIFLQTTKDGATGGRQLPSASGKKEKRKITPPEVAGRVVRPVKSRNARCRPSPFPLPFAIKNRVETCELLFFSTPPFYGSIKP